MILRLISVIYVAAVFVGLCVPTAFAARPPQRREDATHVVTGYVRAVYTEESKYTRGHIVEILIDTVEKGDSLKPRDALEAFCYIKKPATGHETKEEVQQRSLADGYSKVPSQGDQVRAFVKLSRGTYEGIYPDWVDVIKKAESRPVIGSGESGRGAESPAWLWAAGGLVAGLAGGFAAARILPFVPRDRRR